MFQQDRPASLAAPPLLDERSLFTKAATYGDRGDPYYHPPSSRIGSYYTPTASIACDLLEKVIHVWLYMAMFGPCLLLSVTSLAAESYLYVFFRTACCVGFKLKQSSTCHYLMQAAGHGPKSPTKGTSVVVPINAGNRALKTPAFQASPAGIPNDGGLASRYAQLVPTSKAKADLPRANQQLDSEDATYTERQTNDALARCQHYLTAGIDDKHITPFQEDWAVNAVSMLPQQER